MDGSGYGRAFEGFAKLAMVGIFVLGVLVLTGPPAGAWFFAWLAEHRTGLDPRQVWFWAQGTWFLVLAIGWSIPLVADSVRARRQAREHAEFMRLRKLFYRNNEVCTETLASLRRRAGRA